MSPTNVGKSVLMSCFKSIDPEATTKRSNPETGNDGSKKRPRTEKEDSVSAAQWNGAFKQRDSESALQYLDRSTRFCSHFLRQRTEFIGRVVAPRMAKCAVGRSDEGRIRDVISHLVDHAFSVWHALAMVYRRRLLLAGLADAELRAKVIKWEQNNMGDRVS